MGQGIFREYQYGEKDITSFQLLDFVALEQIEIAKNCHTLFTEILGEIQGGKKIPKHLLIVCMPMGAFVVVGPLISSVIA